MCLKCTNGTQEAAKLQHTNAGPQAYHGSLLLGLKHYPTVVPTEILNGLQALGVIYDERQMARETNGESTPTGKGQVRKRRKRCERRLKMGKRAGVHSRLRANASWPALPSILLSNMRSLENKLAYIRLQRTTQQDTRDCCVYVFTETWLNNRVQDVANQLDRLALHHAGRDPTLCSKTLGG